MADRIQGRAIRRCGELLKQFKSVGGRPPAEEKLGEAPPLVSQTAVGTEAGLSRDQIKNAVRVANVPADDFERQIESDNPPTVTKLAEQGKKSRSLILEQFSLPISL